MASYTAQQQVFLHATMENYQQYFNVYTAAHSSNSVRSLARKSEVAVLNISNMLVDLNELQELMKSSNV